MKKIFLCIFIWMLSPHVIYAHPGNTDANGGHTCWTNCEEWGLEYGEYHFHDATYKSYEYEYDYEHKYEEGYNKGFDLAYSYTSQCEEEYDWWWKGHKAFGEGYEQGIEDGHEEGLSICYENSRQAGSNRGYSDYVNDDGYDDTPYKTYDYDSYEDGYAEGWSTAESEWEEDISLSDSASDSDDIDSVLVDSSVDQEALFDDGYEEGYEAAGLDYTYDDFESDLTKEEQKFYQKGYFAGYIEAGSGTVWEKIYYYVFQKYILFTIIIGVLLWLGSILFITNKKSKK
ncbi:hypothetical protein BAMA_16710 [Bacillus manliponensis]|uniref:YHYH domain-containing protein n=1 Tax=Bacillus manliponensis TaxID=574376 RepID=A0A073JYI9_9BACI|nr:YHYH domain-containing protein [Bacillus manliponensis]KEK20094.1 hypothetical protein BAMA_16710 [Bacillus manliponensis]